MSENVPCFRCRMKACSPTLTTRIELTQSERGERSASRDTSTRLIGRLPGHVTAGNVACITQLAWSSPCETRDHGTWAYHVILHSDTKARWIGAEA